MLVRFSHVMIYTHNFPESVAWYCEKLGFEIDYQAPGEYCSLHHKNLGRLALHASVEPPAQNGPMPYLLCENIEKTVLELKKLGVKVGKPTKEGESPWFCDFYDNIGTVWGLEEI